MICLSLALSFGEVPTVTCVFIDTPAQMGSLIRFHVEVQLPSGLGLEILAHPRGVTENSKSQKKLSSSCRNTLGCCNCKFCKLLSLLEVIQYPLGGDELRAHVLVMLWGVMLCVVIT